MKHCRSSSRKLYLLYTLLYAVLLFISASCQSCGPVVDLRDFSDADLFPPVIENITAVDEFSIKLDFNEKASISTGAEIRPSLGELSIAETETSLIIRFSNPQSAGVLYTIDGEVSDSTGNRMNFLIPFYGYNPDLPGLLINEFTTQGSSTHPDIIELLITSDGNTAGLWIVEGTTDYPEESITLPPCAVKSGDYILIHFKPQGVTAEIDEAGDNIGLSGGYDATETARDFWVPGGTGLSGNNGVLAVYSSPGGLLIDGVLYSNRTSASDDTYSGFGSTAMLQKAVQLTEQGGWTGTGSEGLPRPEDGINPDDSTATRSICRNAEPVDTGTAADWHIVPTSSYSFGTENSDEVYTP